MAFAKWKEVGLFVDADGQTLIIPVEGGGRLVYEAYDATGVSGENSKFYEVNILNVTDANAEDQEGVLGHVKLNLSDDSVKELKEDT